MCASPRLGSRENGYNHACCIYRVTRRRREWGRCRGWWAIAEMRKNNTSKFKHAPERAPCYHCNNFFFRRQCSGFFIDGFAGLFGDWKSYYPIIPVLGSRYWSRCQNVRLVTISRGQRAWLRHELSSAEGIPGNGWSNVVTSIKIYCKVAPCLDCSWYGEIFTKTSLLDSAEWAPVDDKWSDCCCCYEQRRCVCACKFAYYSFSPTGR